MKILGIHSWDILEDITVATYVLNGKTDDKSVIKLSKLLGLPTNKIHYRMSNYNKLKSGKYSDWHFSKQERMVFEWLTSKNGLSIKPF